MTTVKFLAIVVVSGNYIKHAVCFESIVFELHSYLRVIMLQIFQLCVFEFALYSPLVTIILTPNAQVPMCYWLTGCEVLPYPFSFWKTCFYIFAKTSLQKFCLSVMYMVVTQAE